MLSLEPEPEIETVELLGANDRRVVLSMGTTTLGRGAFLGVQDKRCSRNQLEINVTCLTVTVQMGGINPSTIQRKDGELISMKREEIYELHHGDVLALLPKEYLFTVAIKRVDPEQHKRKFAAVSPTDSPPEKKVKFEKTSSEEEVAPPPLAKKPSLPSAAPKPAPAPVKDKRTACMFGLKCFRKNPDHFREFSHPPEHPMEKTLAHNSHAVSKALSDLKSTSVASLSSSSASSSAVAKPPVPKLKHAPSDDDILDDDPPPRSAPSKATPPKAPSVVAAPKHKLLLRDDSDEDDAPRPKTLAEIKAAKSAQPKSLAGPSLEPIRPTSPSPSPLTNPPPSIPKIFSSTPPSQSSPHKSQAKSKGLTPAVSSAGLKFVADSSPGAQTLAFAPLATNKASKYPIATAITAAFTAATAFLSAHADKRIRLVLVESDDILIGEFKRRNTVTDSRFIVKKGDLTQMKTKLELPAKYIGNSSNWRFKAGGSGVNKLVHEAAGPALAEEAKKLYNTAIVGEAYPVPLPDSSPLVTSQSVKYVINVVAPTMDPDAPNAISDVAKASEELEKCYAAMFKSFHKLAVGS